MDMMEVWHGAMMGQPHQVTVSGAFVHFVTDMAAPLIITGTGNITVCGKNLFNPDDDSRYAVKVNANDLDRAVYMVWAQDCTVFFSATAIDPQTVTTGNINSSMLYSDGIFRNPSLFLKPGGGVDSHSRTIATGQIAVLSYTTSNTDTLKRNLSRYNLQIEYGDAQTAFEAYNGITAPAGTPRTSLVGINNIWSDSGNITVTYWTH